jgi:hypothetical protein
LLDNGALVITDNGIPDDPIPIEIPPNGINWPTDEPDNPPDNGVDNDDDDDGDNNDGADDELDGVDADATNVLLCNDDIGALLLLVLLLPNDANDEVDADADAATLDDESSIVSSSWLLPSACVSASRAAAIAAFNIADDPTLPLPPTLPDGELFLFFLCRRSVRVTTCHLLPFTDEPVGEPTLLLLPLDVGEISADNEPLAERLVGVDADDDDGLLEDESILDRDVIVSYC